MVFLGWREPTFPHQDRCLSPLPLSQVAWVEDKHRTLAMKTLRARFKKTEVSLRPLRCPVSPGLGFLSPRAWLRIYWALGHCHLPIRFFWKLPRDQGLPCSKLFHGSSLPTSSSLSL